MTTQSCSYCSGLQQFQESDLRIYQMIRSPDNIIQKQSLTVKLPLESIQMVPSVMEESSIEAFIRFQNTSFAPNLPPTFFL